MRRVLWARQVEWQWRPWWTGASLLSSILEVQLTWLRARHGQLVVDGPGCVIIWAIYAALRQPVDASISSEFLVKTWGEAHYWSIHFGLSQFLLICKICLLLFQLVLRRPWDWWHITSAKILVLLVWQSLQARCSLAILATELLCCLFLLFRRKYSVAQVSRKFLLLLGGWSVALSF